MSDHANNRDRVRALLFQPLGFRSPKGTGADAERALLDGIADDLAYLSDADLGVLACMLKVHGEGAARCFWPSRATFAGFAHIVRARPLSEDPALRRWWASIEGQRMVAEGTLVETYQYFEKNRVPPVKDGARSQVQASARDNARRLERIAERERLGYPVMLEDQDWSRWYRERQAELRDLVAQARAARSEKVRIEGVEG